MTIIDLFDFRTQANQAETNLCPASYRSCQLSNAQKPEEDGVHRQVDGVIDLIGSEVIAFSTHPTRWDKKE